MVPSGLRLIRNTHLHPIIFRESVAGTRTQVPFFNRALISSLIATRHRGSLRAWEEQVSSIGSGRGCLVMVWWNCLGLKILCCDLVTIGCVRIGCWERDCGGVGGKGTRGAGLCICEGETILNSLSVEAVYVDVVVALWEPETIKESVGGEDGVWLLTLHLIVE